MVKTCRHFLRLSCAFILSSAFILSAQTVAPAYSGTYTLTSLGSVTGLPTNYGGLIFKDANTIWIGGAANTAPGRFYSVSVTRGAGNHVTGFGTPTILGFGTHNDGGVAFSPSGVLFYAEYSNNSIGQVISPFTSDHSTTVLTGLGVTSSVGAANFVPAGFNGAGQFKVASYTGSTFYSIPLSSDGTGGSTLGTASLTATLNTCPSTCGPEGFVYLPLGSPLFTGQNMLMAEYGSGTIGVYAIDANGNPIPGTRVSFVTGLTGAEGAAIDPVTGDFFFSTFGGSSQVIEVQGFAIPATTPIPPTWLLSLAGLAAITVFYAARMRRAA